MSSLKRVLADIERLNQQQNQYNQALEEAVSVAISNILRQKKWTQEELASHLGVHPSYISNLKNEKQSPSLNIARELASLE